MTERFVTSRYTLKVLDISKNKKALYMLKKYFSWSKDSTIFTIYGKPCDANVKAYYRLKDDMVADNGFDFRCGNPTCHSWCCAYQVPAYGDLSYLIYHTRDNVYCIAIPKPYGKA